MVLAPANDRPAAIVYYDGACPLCRLEIGHYKTCDRLRAIRFVDVSRADADTGNNLARAAAMARFHVRQGNGELVSGAEAFVAVWQVLPRWRVLAQLAKVPGVLPALEGAYRAFLKVRPYISARLRRAGF
jgi:predicted DCC family thiol-disulfide oxidoreductase YuxK